MPKLEMDKDIFHQHHLELYQLFQTYLWFLIKKKKFYNLKIKSKFIKLILIFSFYKEYMSVN